jgi:CRISPR/Cas system-associated exonuclease Cas4 (RecB family)
MRLFEQELATRLTTDRLHRLLLLEKERRGIDGSKLVFVGMANIAHYWWCAMQSVLKSVEMEPAFFGAYLMDRLLYSHQLGHITALPRKTEAWLEIGSQITFEDIETLLRERGKKANKLLKRAKGENKIDTQVVSLDTIDDAGNVITLLNPMLSSEEKEHFAEEAQARGSHAVSWDSTSLSPKLRGKIHQMSKAETYPTIRWNFVWHDYVVVGVPDGIMDNFVYEFKSTASRFLCNYYIKPVALAQADIYGYFFRRRRKRVQIYVMEEDNTQTWDELVSEERALKTLNDFERIDKGELAKPAKAWKCKSCEFTSSCPIHA